jgi:hypothetical protein
LKVLQHLGLFVGRQIMFGERRDAPVPLGIGALGAGYVPGLIVGNSIRLASGGELGDALG